MLDYLKHKDKVAIVSPAGRVFEDEISESLALLKQWNLRPVLGKNIFEDFDLGYHYAGTDNQKIADIQTALDDDETKAIWCTRGGYGSVRLLDKLNWTRFKSKPKWLIGYSDITAFHNHLNNMNIPTIHGITLKKLNINYTKETHETLKKALFGETLKYKIKPHKLNKSGEAQGKLIGGNLSIIYSLLGSPSAINAENSILFIEDWNENWYHIDRMMMNLERNNILNKIKALIVGGFTQMDVKEENQNYFSSYDQTTYAVIDSIMKKYEIPIAYAFPAGHIEDNRALIFGREIHLKIDSNNVNLEYI